MGLKIEIYQQKKLTSTKIILKITKRTNVSRSVYYPYARIFKKYEIT